MDLLPTIEDDEELEMGVESDTEDEGKVLFNSTSISDYNQSLKEVCPFSSDFQFRLDGIGSDTFNWHIDDAIVMASKKNPVSKPDP